ncbi:MAG: flavodoxin family protein [Anaerolineae bacterium]|jgi:flavodoxin|nr:flavodoxin family protein [Anaerolineae bacterium]MDX9832047.1 flavodoxin family protein [Anaerolineae bacterium]
MKSVVIYESVYGNTRTIAEAIAAALPGEVKLQNVTGASVAGLEAGDLLVVGAPTHGGRPTETTQGFLDQLPANSLAGIRVAGFDTRLTAKWVRIFGYAGPRIEAALGEKGGTPVGSPGGFFVKGKEGPLANGEVERAAAWARQIAG